MNKLHQFVEFCRNTQPQSREDIQRFFEGVVFFPYDNELLLQAFLFLNIGDYFPSCAELLLFERSPNGENTDQGKCDFVYLTQSNRIVLVETKFIDTENTGGTERARRNAHRNKVFQQVIILRHKFSDTWSIPVDLIDCCIFTTEDLTYRSEATVIEAKHIPIQRLKKWQEETNRKLQANINISPQIVFQESADDSGLDEVDKMLTEPNGELALASIRAEEEMLKTVVAVPRSHG